MAPASRLRRARERARAAVQAAAVAGPAEPRRPKRAHAVVLGEHVDSAGVSVNVFDARLRVTALTRRPLPTSHMQAIARSRSARRRHKCSLETATRQNRCGHRRCVVIFVSLLVCESQFLAASSFCRAQQRAHSADPPAAIAAVVGKRRRDGADAIVIGVCSGDVSRRVKFHDVLNIVCVCMYMCVSISLSLSLSLSLFLSLSLSLSLSLALTLALTLQQQAAYGGPASERAQPIRPPPSQVQLSHGDRTEPMQSSSVCRVVFQLTRYNMRVPVCALTLDQQAAFAAPASERVQPIRPPPSQVSLSHGDPSGPVQSASVRLNSEAMFCSLMHA
jgi:hypothetical protein